MKKRLLAAILSLVMLTTSSIPVKASENASESLLGAFPEDLIAGYATAYSISGTTASGIETTQGICASSPDRIGTMILLYQRLPDGSVGDYIGMWECMDTGGNDAINAGTLIDVYEPTQFDCCEFMDKVYENGCQGKVWIQVIEGEG